jgi:hypothetical protein
LLINSVFMGDATTEPPIRNTIRMSVCPRLIIRWARLKKCFRKPFS